MKHIIMYSIHYNWDSTMRTDFHTTSQGAIREAILIGMISTENDMDLERCSLVETKLIVDNSNAIDNQLVLSDEQIQEQNFPTNSDEYDDWLRENDAIGRYAAHG